MFGYLIHNLKYSNFEKTTSSDFSDWACGPGIIRCKTDVWRMCINCKALQSLNLVPEMAPKPTGQTNTNGGQTTQNTQTDEQYDLVFL